MEGIKDEDIIDLACGTGFYTRILREKTSGKVYGVDISEDMIKYAKSKLKSSDGEIKYILHDCTIPIKLDMQFDIVSATFLY
jgi:ubiquinone/menaquinone biosynthesis C-methylase UbiE